MPIVARSEELERGRAYLAAADGLRGLVVKGAAGMGKTTVWQALVDEAAAGGRLVLSCRAAAAEATYAFASLSDLLAPLVDESLELLPEPQRVALEVALLHASPPRTPLNRRAVGVATQTLLERAASRGGVVVAIDDLQWVDAASAAALSYALRRLVVSPASVIATLRADLPDRVGMADALGPRLEELRLGPLTLSGLFHVIEAGLGRKLSRPTLQRVADSSNGNPLFALELARALGELDVQPGPGDPLPVPQSLDALMAGRVRRLPSPVHDVLLAAALMSSPTVDALERALGDGVVEGLARAEAAGVVIVDGDRVRFAHPLLAAAVHAEASRSARRTVHAALAVSVTEPEEQVRHLALAAAGPDESVASALDESARKVDAGGAPQAAAELAELAHRLTPSDAVAARAGRERALAEYAFRAGDTARALAIADHLHAELPAGPLRASVCELLVHLSWVARTDTEAMRYARQALAEYEDVEALARLHVILARVSYIDPARSLKQGLALLDAIDDPDPRVLGHALTAKLGAEVWTVDELPKDLVDRALELEDAAPAQYVADRVSASLGVWLRVHGDLDGARQWLETTHRAVVDEGDESSLPYVLGQLAQLELHAGNWAEAERFARAHLAAAEEAAQSDHRRQALFNLTAIHVHGGTADVARAEALDLLCESEEAGDAWMVIAVLAILGLLELSAGDGPAAVSYLARHQELFVDSGRRDPMRAHADHVEALVETGDIERAAEVAAFLHDLTRPPSPSPTRAIAHRANALVAAANGEADDAARAVDAALEQHERAPIPFDLARTLNVAGQVHRRRGERRAARDAFDRARGIFAELGATLWVARVEAEARRVPIKRRASDDLTPSELQVAQLIAAGRTTRDVAAELFISPKTVEANLTRVYRKLAIGSRAELGAEMARRSKT
jgi:DNA-binding CsgD family transcriptional regulator